MSNYTGFMYLGELVEFGQTEDLFTKPVTDPRLRLHHRPLRLDLAPEIAWSLRGYKELSHFLPNLSCESSSSESNV